MRIIASVGLIVALVTLMSACNSKKDDNGVDLANQMADTNSAVVAANQQSQPVVAQESKPIDSEGLLRNVSDMVITDDKVYATFDGGLAVYDFIAGTDKIVCADERFDAVAMHEGVLYVGGNSLYTLNENLEMKATDSQYEGPVTALCDYGPRLVVGTANGLYAVSVFGNEKLMDDVAVTALVADDDGLWVGTDGQGLYRWDGVDFTRRYLLRDTAVFDTVRTLAYSHSHLYVGSSNGFHVFDGGKWVTLTTDDGLPSNHVTSIDASDWVVYVGTDQGVMSYFNSELAGVNKLEDKPVTVLRRYNGKLIVGTEFEGILQQSRSTLKTIVQPDSGLQLSYLSLIQ